MYLKVTISLFTDIVQHFVLYHILRVLNFAICMWKWYRVNKLYMFIVQIANVSGNKVLHFGTNPQKYQVPEKIITLR